MLRECGALCRTDTGRDLNTVTLRVEYEGLSFLTITLPGFGSDFERCLDRGWVGSDLFTGFKWKGGLPAFLQGFLCRVFDASTGVLLPIPCVESIRSIRQLTKLFGKIEIPCNEHRTRKALTQYVQTDLDVGEIYGGIDAARLRHLRRDFHLLYGKALRRMESSLEACDFVRFVPRHGGGATADRLAGNVKWLPRTWSCRLEGILPAGEFILPNWRYHDRLQDVDILEPGDELPVRVVCVPKSLKTPRIIAEEPAYRQYAQQAVLSALLAEWNKDEILLQFCDFKSQERNRAMALEGSLTGELATLDLSEASDRVSNQLVHFLLSDWPLLREAIGSCRGETADVPGHGIISLNKYASMGSALTFPIEVMVFLAITLSSMAEKGFSTPVTERFQKNQIGRVCIYGDDIIVPVDMVHHVIEGLEAFGLKVNSDKSFWTGRFRESCGKEYYKGDDVSIVKVRRVFPTSRGDVNEVLALQSLRNQLYMAGYWTVCQRLDERLRRILRHFPVVESTSSVIGRWSIPFSYEEERLHPDYQAPLVRGYVVSARSPKSPLGDVAALVKFFCLRNEEPIPDAKHLERSGRPHAVDIKLRWAQPV